MYQQIALKFQEKQSATFQHVHLGNGAKDNTKKRKTLSIIKIVYPCTSQKSLIAFWTSIKLAKNIAQEFKANNRIVYRDAIL
jgi:hypothetical protein